MKVWGGGATCILENEDQQSFPGTSAAGKRGRLEISRRKIAICEFMQVYDLQIL